MARANRNDVPDSWHHVLNRGIAKRTIFETERDCRFFKALLAREVRAGRIEVHAYCLMITHFHVLVRSTTGELSEAMRRIQNRYARYFNRTRKRDGSLFRSRFKSRWVDSIRYRRNVVGYIHDNAVVAKAAARRSEYRWSSARDWKDGKPPRWMSRKWIEDELAAKSVGRDRTDHDWDDRMDAAFPSSIPEQHRKWIERQLRNRHADGIEDCSLKHSASPDVVSWSIRKAKLADGTRPWRPVCPANLVEQTLDRSRAILLQLVRLFPGSVVRAHALVRAGLLRMLSGCTHREIAMRTGRHRGTVAHDIQDHRERLEAKPAYARLASTLMHAVLAAAGV
jgi:REP element-mobilizing transposase RayT